jgi:hypothetical protein
MINVFEHPLQKSRIIFWRASHRFSRMIFNGKPMSNEDELVDDPVVCNERKWRAQ